MASSHRALLRFIKTPFLLFLAAAAVYLLCLWFSLQTGSLLLHQPIPMGSAPNRIRILFLLPFLLLAGLAFIPQNRQTLLLQGGWALIFCAAVANRTFGWVPFITYGDRGRFSQYILEGVVFPRWLGGSAIAGWLYTHLWQNPLVAGWLPPALADLDSFTVLLGALVMAAGSVLILGKWRGRLAVLLPMLTPVWLMFCAGYNEYYPYIAPLFLACLGWSFLDRLEDGRPWLVGALCALPAVFYIGFAPFSALMLVFFIIKRPRKILAYALGAALAYFACVLLFWPGSLSGFFEELHASLNLGERYTKYPPYQGLSASDNSIFFRPDYALSAQHLGELAVMYFWGGGWAAPLALLGGAAFSFRRGLYVLKTSVVTMRKGMHSETREDALRLIWGILLTGWQWFYFLFMIPKLGPVQDVDLFFTTYLVTAFFGGLLLERMEKPLPRLLLLAAYLGSSAASSVYLLVWGIAP